MNITIQNPSRKFLAAGVYQARTAQMAAKVELIDHPTSGLVFRAVGLDNGRFLRPVDPLFWMSDEGEIEIEVEEIRG